MSPYPKVKEVSSCLLSHWLVRDSELHNLTVNNYIWKETLKKVSFAVQSKALSQQLVQNRDLMATAAVTLLWAMLMKLPHQLLALT